MTMEQIALTIDNSYENCDRIWFSGGEPTVVMEKLLFGLKYAKDKKDVFGFPHKICVQTNGNLAKTKQGAIKYLAQFYRHGANEIDITSNDVFHFEQMDKEIPSMLATTANNMGVLESVMIGGSDYKVVKRFGRAKNITLDGLKGFDLKYTRKCVLTESDYVIHPNGDVFPCIYGFENVLGNIYEKKLRDIIGEYTSNPIYSSLKDGGIYEIFKEAIKEDINGNSDICDICNSYVFSCRSGRKEHC
jgi:radical SAM protein with 4Fe4S-binding SPASM domain